jgi:hypothetical protein
MLCKVDVFKAAIDLIYFSSTRIKSVVAMFSSSKNWQQDFIVDY